MAVQKNKTSKQRKNLEKRKKKIKEQQIGKLARQIYLNAQIVAN